MDDAEDGYGSETWGEIDYNDLIAVADEVEKQATPTKPPAPAPQTPAAPAQQHLWFTDDDFDDFDDDDMLSAAVPSIAITDEVEVVDLTSSVETLRAGIPPSPKPRVKSPKPRAKSPKPRAKSPKPRTKSPKPRTKSPKPWAKSPKPRAKSPKPRAKSPSPGSPRPLGGARLPNAPQTPQQNRANVVKRKPSKPLLDSRVLRHDLPTLHPRLRRRPRLRRDRRRVLDTPHGGAHQRAARIPSRKRCRIPAALATDEGRRDQPHGGAPQGRRAI
ncbi:hypothetical protein DFP73DRAFT_60876 [Morchella snyderi]|nr:hypothetical protein DFP73DRAFT_60876 [Morchella snyderi]